MMIAVIKLGPADLDIPEVARDPSCYRAFNPAIIADARGFILAFRLVGPGGQREIGICRLDGSLRVRPGSALIISRLIRLQPGAGNDWYADPRLYRFGGRLYLYWNSGWQEPMNHQFLIELDDSSLVPSGPAQSLHLTMPAQAIEKNWTFIGDNLDYAIYAPQPHRVLRLAHQAHGRLVFEEVLREDWPETSFTKRYAPLRGGAPPVQFDGTFMNFCHCVVSTSLGYRYFAAAYSFAATPPFRLLSLPTTVLGLGRKDGIGLARSAFNPATEHVVYPSGALRQGNDWLIAYGLNDTQLCLSRLPLSYVAATQAPCHTSGHAP